MLLSNACEYGIRAVSYMAVHMEDEYMSVGEISKELNISFHFLTKTLQKLTQAKILKSYRGPQGGIRFYKDPKNISLTDIVKAIDGPGIFEECIIGLPGCNDDEPCPLHEKWKAQREMLAKTFDETSLKDLADNIKRDDLRLAPNRSPGE